MSFTGVSDEDGPFLDRMPRCSICSAHIDVMLVVNASTNRILLNDEIAHLDGVFLWWWCSWFGGNVRMSIGSGVTSCWRGNLMSK